MTLLITVNEKHISNAASINVIGKVIISDVFISIIVMSNQQYHDSRYNDT